MPVYYYQGTIIFMITIPIC